MHNAHRINLKAFLRFGKEAGIEIVKFICEEIGAIRTSVPAVELFGRIDRDWNIMRRFTGNNFEELALDYGLSSRQVRNIVHNCRRVRALIPRATKRRGG